MDYTRWTIRLAMLAYVAALALQITRSGRWRLARGFWCAACGLTWVHVLIAFAVHHHWSHTEAYAYTAQETAAKTGVSWGGGLYFNYLFLGVWTLDALWWCWAPAAWQQRSRLWSVGVQTYLGFIAFNATVVFETGATRLAGLAAAILLATLACWQWRCNTQSSDAHQPEGRPQTPGVSSSAEFPDGSRK